MLAEYALYILAATHDLTVLPDIEAYLLHPDPAAYDVVNVSRPHDSQPHRTAGRAVPPWAAA